MIRALHFVNIGVQAVGTVLAVWLYAQAPMPIFGIWAGACAMWGCLSLRQLRRREGLQA